MKYLLLTLFLVLEFQANGQNLTFRSNTPYAEQLSDVWGWSDGSNEYAIVGYYTGFSIVDVTDPDSPVKLHEVEGPASIWRDIKTYGDYAYGVHEYVGQDGQGLVIMDMSGLPGSVGVNYWHTDGTQGVYLRDAHNLFIDENGVAYIVGNNVDDGVLMLDLTADPENPIVLGQYTDNYVHDCFARNDTLWTAEVDAGEFAVLDINVKEDPQTMARQETPLSFTHNIWLSDDGRTAFTTDERSNGPITAYDVSDLEDIEFLDAYRSNPQVIPHNVTVVEDFVVASMYRDGIVMLDISFPDEMVEMGRYDTSPDLDGNGFNGSWGVYPYLPSGNILASDIERGLYVLTPNYQKAIHIRGNVRNADTHEVLKNVFVEISGAGINELRATNLAGNFKIGLSESGSFDITFTKENFQPVFETVNLQPGDVAFYDLEMTPVTLTVADTIYAEVSAGSSVLICDSSDGGINSDYSYICDYSSSSEYGSWSNNESGCLTYTADQTGNITDSLCFVLTNSETGENNVNLIIVTVNDITTGIADLHSETQDFELVENPVHDRLILIHNGDMIEKVSISIYDTQGRLQFNSTASTYDSRLEVPVYKLNSGLYLIGITGTDGQTGYHKFVKF